MTESTDSESLTPSEVERLRQDIHEMAALVRDFPDMLERAFSLGRWGEVSASEDAEEAACGEDRDRIQSMIARL